MFQREISVSKRRRSTADGDGAAQDVRGDDGEDSVTLSIGQSCVGCEAVVVWDAALVLAKYLEKHREELRLDEGISVVELGAGTGAAGLVAAALGAHVLVTDLTRVLPLLASNVEANREALSACGGGSVSAAALHWGDAEQIAHARHALGSPPQLVLVADCVYYAEAVEPLVRTLSLLSGAEPCRVLLSYEERDSEEKRAVAKEFQRRVAAEFVVERIRTEECHEDFAADDIVLLRLTKAKRER